MFFDTEISYFHGELYSMNIDINYKETHPKAQRICRSN